MIKHSSTVYVLKRWFLEKNKKNSEKIMISCCIFGLTTWLNVISQNSETYQTLAGRFLLFFPKSGSQTLNFLLMWAEIIILLKESMCNDLCVLVKPTNDVTLFYAMSPSKSRYIQICHVSPSISFFHWWLSNILDWFDCCYLYTYSNALSTIFLKF